MKYRILILSLVLVTPLSSQNLQLHYDVRHSIDPSRNPKNYPTLYYEYFKGQDSGSFLLKVQTDFTGEMNNVGQFYTQISRLFRFWEPKIYAQAEYSGGVGVADPGQFGYYISNTFSAGAAYPFQWRGGYFSASLSYSYTAFKRPSQDPLFSFYWWEGLFNYHAEFAGDFEAWTQNRDHGDGFALGGGKIFFVYGQPQLWLKLTESFFVGTKVNIYYHLLTQENLLQVYPTIAVRYKF